jgi:hypothetical protein
VATLLLLALLQSPSPAPPAQAPTPGPREEALLEAVRAGDLPAVRAALDAGAAVDARFPYGRTALSFAADRGHEAIVRLLLERHAAVDARDSFYRASALDLALHKGHAGTARALIEGGASGAERALGRGVEKGNLELVRLALDKAGPTADELSAALAAASRAGHDEIVQALREAGAVPPPPADFQVPPELLARYAGTYRDAKDGFAANLVVQDGKLVCTNCGARPWVFEALDAVTFRLHEREDTKLSIREQAGRVTGLTWREGREETVFERIEPEASQP